MKDEKRAKAKDEGQNGFHSSLIPHPLSFILALSSLIFRCVYRSQHRARLIHRLLKLGGRV